MFFFTIPQEFMQVITEFLKDNKLHLKLLYLVEKLSILGFSFIVLLISVAGDKLYLQFKEQSFEYGDQKFVRIITFNNVYKAFEEVTNRLKIKLLWNNFIFIRIIMEYILINYFAFTYTETLKIMIS